MILTALPKERSIEPASATSTATEIPMLCLIRSIRLRPKISRFFSSISGFFTSQVIQGPDFTMSLFYIFLLSLFGTAIAKVLFNNLVQISTPIFASSVTYLMPIIAVSWGVLDGESFGFWQGVATVIILLGVYLANSKR